MSLIQLISTRNLIAGATLFCHSRRQPLNNNVASIGLKVRRHSHLILNHLDFNFCSSVYKDEKFQS